MSKLLACVVLLAAPLATLVAPSVSIPCCADSPKFRSVHPQAPGLFCWADTANVYVLKSGESAVLFNFGSGSVMKALPTIGIKQVDTVFLTDHHRENCQGLADVALTNTTLATSEIEQEILESPNSFRKWFPKLGDTYSVYGASYVRPPARPLAINKVLKPDEVVTWNDYEIRCVATPGTSPGGMSYLIKQGDMTVAVSGSLMHDQAKLTNWYDSEWDYGFGKGLDTLIESVERLQEYELDLALPTQGPVIQSAQQQFKDYAAKLISFRKLYVRGYPVFNQPFRNCDPISQPTAVTHINRVTPHLYKLSSKHPGKNFAIIVSDNGHGLVLDCGLIPVQTLEEIVLGMREHLGLKQIDAFWISHMHGDHFLLGPTMRKRFAAEAWTLDKIVDRCEYPRRYDYAALVSTYGDGFDGMPIDKAFADGETIEWEGYKIQVDWMPGQTEFGCCLWLDIDGKRVAFTGDNLFGNTSDESQTGHEAVVCRNSCILEEGYIRGSKYLLDLKPDLVMGSHSYVMPNPTAFLQRYHDWSKEMEASYRAMLPEQDYEYLFDPYWVSAYPYRVDLSEADSQEVTITVRNFRDRAQQHRVELVLPKGVTATPAVLEGEVPAESRRKYQVTLRRGENTNAADIQLVPFEISLDGKRYGQLFDFLMRLPN